MLCFRPRTAMRKSLTQSCAAGGKQITACLALDTTTPSKPRPRSHCHLNSLKKKIFGEADSFKNPQVWQTERMRWRTPGAPLFFRT